MKKIVFLITQVLIGAAPLLAQNLAVEGTIKGEAGEALEMANIIVMSAVDSSMSAYAFSDEKGFFQLKVKAGESYILRVSYLGYETLDKLFESTAEERKMTIPINLIKKEELLNEVQVVEEMPIMISGDTISYKADAFNNGNEKKLEDVIENLPGFEVDDDGQVKVEGKVVEKIMVEGKEFFDGDSKIALKNIPANAIDKVQVLRNYNDVTSFGGVATNDDRIAINIKLKDGKKNMVFGDVEAAGGPEARYLGHANIFLYSPKSSVNVIADVNNVGQPAFTMRDYFRFTGGFRGMGGKSGSNLMVGQDIGIPMGNSDRNVEITSQFGAMNFNFNPNKAWTINGFVIANGNDIVKKTITLNNYVGQDTLDSQEKLTTNEAQNDKSLLGKLSVKYTPNARLYFAYDALTKYSQSDVNNTQLSQFEVQSRNITSNNLQNPFEINQNLEAVYELNARGIISFQGQMLYKKQDPFFSLVTDQKPNFGFILPVDSNNAYALNQSRLITTNKLDGILSYYYILNKKNHIEFSTGGSYSKQELSSALAQMLGETEYVFTDTALQNDVTFSLSDAFGGIHFKTKLGKLTMRPGLNAHYYKTKDQQWSAPLERNWFMVLPDFFAKYELKKSENLSLTYNMQAGFTDVNNAALGFLLNSYNSGFIGNQYLTNAIYHSLNVNYFNYNIFNFTTIYAGFNYNKRIRDITNTVTYLGTDRVNTPINSDNANDVFSGYGNYQRRFGFYKASAGANVSYSITNNLVNDVQNSNYSLGQNYNLRFGTNYKKAPNVDVGYRVSISNYTGTGVNNTFVNHMPFIDFEWAFLDGFLFEAGYKYNYYTSPNTGPSSIFDFLDATIYYETKNEKWEFRTGVTNLLNTEYIRQDSFNNSVTSTQELYVLPRYLLFGVKYKI